MADVMSHGGDGGGEPPRRPGKRLAERCVASRQTKRRGVSRSRNLHKLWIALDGKLLPIQFDIDVLGTWQPIGKNRKYFTRLVGNKIKEIVVPCYKDWASVPEEDRTKVLDRVQSYFDMRGNLTDYQYNKALQSVDRLAADRFRGYKARAHAYYKMQQEDPSLTAPYMDISAENWQRCLDLFNSPEFVARSEKNKENRAKQKYPCLHGSKSLVAHCLEWDEPEAEEMPGIIETFRDFHTKNGDWVNEAAAADYARLCDAVDAQGPEVIASGGVINQRAIAREVLGSRRGHERGVGRILRGARTQSIQDIAESSLACHGSAAACTGVSPDASSYALLQKKVRKLEMVIARLSANAGLSAEDEDDEPGSNAASNDGDEDLGPSR